ncbi:hypothetical protein E1J38_000150 [Seonamhaeicola sediminis]|uniref:Uncharacterized protein n=1 Tax=Seonamhaeicola sediminis TaxID=2528206 RepID=A0A562YHR0_9FLAO|nr:hypothetical protein [Seonamhaeicola sediminis]TWO34298.1 hypothetical protein E1J38_000150 [Seonamhaeicola sediminis]
MTFRKYWLRQNILLPALFLVLITSEVFAQPYVDPLQLRYNYALKNRNAEATPFTHIWVGSDIPIEIKKNTYLVFSPFFEFWQIESDTNNEISTNLESLALAAGIVFPLKNQKWSITVLPILRWNGEYFFQSDSMQFGSVAFASYTLNPKQKFRLGIYANKEFFGLFVVPLIGIDWKIKEKHYLFGILPGRLSYEYQYNSKIYIGATFRSLTNSYKLINSEFIRLDDNQISLYLDYYLTKTICISFEPGYGLFRQMRKGINNKDYFSTINWGDGPFVKLSASYRIRL